jgi:preprotein translocase subunit YajC
MEGPFVTVDAVGALFPFVLILAAFYLLIIRPARNRQRAALQLQSELGPGQEVMTTSGMFATVSSVEDDAVVLQVSPGVTMRFAKAAVARILPPEESSTGTPDTPDTAD